MLSITNRERCRIASVLKRARGLANDVASDDRSPMRRARARSEIVGIDQAIELITNAVQRATAGERRAN
jgi:hypothetical protein